MSDCEHRDIQTWFFEGGDVAGTWSCVSCGHRFVPITELMEAEAERDEARAELGRLTKLRPASEHVAWLRYVNRPMTDECNRIVLCDSDAEGAFKVYRHPIPPPKEPT